MISNKIKTRRSPGTKILEVPGIKEIKMTDILKRKEKKKIYGLNKKGKNKFRS